MIRTYTTVFIGANVNPKTKEPVFVEREEHTERTVNIQALIAKSGAPYYASIGSGYLNANDDKEYSGSTQVTGYPRSHTPTGISDGLKGMGYGTCLYTGLVQLATAHFEGDIYLPRIDGRGAGISSEEDTRSDEASEWWDGAVRRGLAHTDYGSADVGDEPEEEEETLEGEDLENYMSPRQYTKVVETIAEAIDNYGEWSFDGGLYIRGDLRRTVEGDSETKEITANYYTFKDALKYRLIVVQAPYAGDFEAWTKVTDEAHIKDAADGAYKDVILALNVAHQDAAVIGKLALIARAGGATDREVTELMLRNRYQMDIISKRVPPPPAWFGPSQQVRRVRMPPQIESGTKKNPARRGHLIPVLRKNPPPEPTGREKLEIDRALDNLAQRREALGWNQLEDLS